MDILESLMQSIPIEQDIKAEYLLPSSPEEGVLVLIQAP